MSSRTYLQSDDLGFTRSPNTDFIASSGVLFQNITKLAVSNFGLKNTIPNINIYNKHVSLTVRKSTAPINDIIVDFYLEEGLYSSVEFFRTFCRAVNAKLALVYNDCIMGYDQNTSDSNRPSLTDNQNRIPFDNCYRLYMYIAPNDYKFVINNCSLVQYPSVWGINQKNLFDDHYITGNIGLYFSKYIDIKCNVLNQYITLPIRSNGYNDSSLLHRYYFKDMIRADTIRGYVDGNDPVDVVNIPVVNFIPDSMYQAHEPYNLNYIVFNKSLMVQKIDIALFDSYNNPIYQINRPTDDANHNYGEGYGLISYNIDFKCK